MSGPPPKAFATPSQLGLSVNRTVTWVPTGASAARAAAPDPRAWSTAPPDGIGVEPAVAEICVTTPTRSVFGTAAENGLSTASTDRAAGVLDPQVGVKIETPFVPSSWLRLTGRRDPVPRQKPR